VNREGRCSQEWAGSRLVSLWQEHGDPSLRDRVADAWIGAQAYRMHAFAGLDLPARDASLTKLFWSELDVALHETALDVLGPRAETDAAWTDGYKWRKHFGVPFVQFEPLFGHQYSHCWIDFRHRPDNYLMAKGISYFENSRRATLAQRAYCIANPGGFSGYSSNVWGITACDGPGFGPYAGYNARGAPPAQNDDGTLAPTALGGSMPFASEVCLPALRYLYDQYRTNIWFAYGYRDAFNLTASWWDSDAIGIDEGPIVIMVENYRTQKVWQRFMQVLEVQRGLQSAGFTNLPFVMTSIQKNPGTGALTVSWPSSINRSYQVEYSPDLFLWMNSPTGYITASQSISSWVDNGPPATDAMPALQPQRFYRVYQFGAP